MRLRKLFAGVAAMATLLGGMALGANAAYAAEGPADVAVDLGEANGTITVKAQIANESPNPVNGHEFKYVALGYYDGAVTNDGKLKSVSIVTNKDYVAPLESFVKTFESTATNVPAGVPTYAKSPEYAGNPAAYLAKYYGGDFTDGSTQSPQWSGTPRSLLTALANEAWFKAAYGASTAVTGVDGSATITGRQGWYAVVDTTTGDVLDASKSATNTAYTGSLPMLVGTTVVSADGKQSFDTLGDQAAKLGVINVKNELLTVHKKIVEGNKDKLSADRNIGDTVDYKLTGAVPNTTGYASYTYTLTDTLSKGLTLASVNGMKLTVGDKTYPLSAEDGAVEGTFVDGAFPVATVKIADASDTEGDYAGGHVLTVEFSHDWILAAGQDADHVGKDIKVTYTATLNQQAVVGQPGNPNKVDLTYSNNPGDQSSTTTVPGETPKVYTYQFDFTKVEYSSNAFQQSKKLKGAEFQVLGEDGKPIKFIQDKDADGKLVGGSYTKAETADAEGATDTLVTPESGKLTVKGLDANVDKPYTVKETKAPTGYLQSALPQFTVSIVAKTDSQDPDHNVTGEAVLNYGEDFIWNLVDTKNHLVGNVTNITKLPLTGAAGTAMFTMIGVLLAGAGALVYVRSRRTRRMIAA